MSYLDEYVKNLNKVEQETLSGDRNLLEAVVGTGYYGVAKPFGDAVGYAVDQTPLPEVGEFLLDQTSVDETIGNLINKASEYVPERGQRFLKESLGIAEAASGARFLTAAGNKALQVSNPQKYSSDTSGMTKSSGSVLVDGYYGGPAARKAALVNFGADGLKQMALNIANPSRSAMYRDYGLTPQVRRWAQQTSSKKALLDDFDKGNVDKYVEAYAKDQYNALGDKTKKEKTFQQWKEGKEFSTKKVRDSLVKDYDDSLELFQAQLQANAHIREQSNAPQADVRDIPSEAAQIASARSGKTYFGADDFGGDWFNSAANFDVRTGKKVMPESRARTFQEHISRTWENAAGINTDGAILYVKRPTGKFTGNHSADLQSYGNLGREQTKVLRDLFATDETFTYRKDGTKATTKSGKPIMKLTGHQAFDTVKELRTVMDEQLQELKANKSDKTFNIIDSDSDGIYVQYSFAGRGKTEGGVNAITHVNKDGTLTTVISDVHDMAVGGEGFWGKLLSPLNKYLHYSMKDELTVTPPIVDRVVGSKGGTNKGTKEAVSREDIESFQNEVTKLRPSRETSVDEIVKRLGGASVLSAGGEGEPLERDPETGEVIIRITK